MKSIQEIHNSNLYGVIIEAGCSATIASTLMNEPGSSKTIYDARQPYSKDIQERLYGKHKRSVSKEFIEHVLNVEWSEAEYTSLETGINFILAASWQLPSPEDATVYSHGWVGLFDIQRNKKHYLHFSLNRNLFRGYREIINTELKSGDGGAAFLDNDYSEHKYAYDLADRKTALQIIGQLAINVLHTGISGDIETLEMPSSDTAVLDMAYINNDINYHLLINTLEKVKGDYFLVFDNGEVTRIEDLLRKSNEHILLRGSFNPAHSGHTSILNYSKEEHINANMSFLISTNRYDKPHLSINEVKERIININKLNYSLIICKNPYFYGVFDLLNKWSYNKRFFYPIGCDTINRILKTDIEENNDIEGMVNKYKNIHKFILFNRKGYNRINETSAYNMMLEENNLYMDDGISSTKIRENLF